MKNVTLVVFAAIFIFLLSSAYVASQPEGPTSITAGPNERRVLGIDNSTGGTKIHAQAGNVTALRINSTRLTRRWQGYYGNITGTITLDDANNNTLYNWELINPKGEIYAANDSSVLWSSIFCFNYTNNLSDGSAMVQRFNGTDLERTIGAEPGEKDSVNGTFNATFSGAFHVGSTLINGSSGCRQVTLFVNDQYQTSDFVEVLLTDNRSIIYTSLLEQDATGFQGSTLDFEMIVGENGDTVEATNYYFFVELA